MDELLESLVAVYGERIVTAILTGMGCDGLAGCRVVKAAGGVVVAQNRESCTVYGMPKAVIDAGLADTVLPLDAIGDTLAGSWSRRCCRAHPVMVRKSPFPPTQELFRGAV